MRKEKSRSPPKLSNGRFLLILACLPTTCKNTDSQGCVSIDFTLYYLGDCWYFPNRQNKKSQGKIAKTVFDCRQSGGRTELVVNPAEGDYNGMYPARVYEVEMRLASRPGSVTVNGVKTDAWSYGDGLLKVAVTQPDVRKKSVLVAE